MNDYAFHPEAFADLDQIWEYIAGVPQQSEVESDRGVPSAICTASAKRVRSSTRVARAWSSLEHHFQ